MNSNRDCLSSNGMDNILIINQNNNKGCGLDRRGSLYFSNFFLRQQMKRVVLLGLLFGLVFLVVCLGRGMTEPVAASFPFTNGMSEEKIKNVREYDTVISRITPDFLISLLRGASVSGKGKEDSAQFPGPILDGLQDKYALVIDAGSSGTRMHVYTLSYAGRYVHSLKDEVFFEVPIGLSSFADDVSSMEEVVFAPMLKRALESVPGHLFYVTPVCVKATAGLRLLPIEKSEMILEKVREILSKWPFPPEKKDLQKAVSVISGKDEGVWGWLTLNFLLDRIGFQRKNSLSAGLDTVAIMDLGGASTQIVFEITKDQAKELPSEFVYSFEFSGVTYHLYQNSFLGYGLNQARLKILSLNGQRGWSPCIPRVSDTNKDGQQINHRIDVKRCLRDVKRILNLDAPCSHGMCLFDGVPSPANLSFEKYEIYGFSNFYDIMSPFSPSDKDNFQMFIGQFWSHILASCDVSGQAIKDNPTKTVPRGPDLSLKVAPKELPNFCMDSLYVYSLLKHGYKMLSSVSVVKKIRGIETCWALGAAMQILDEFGDQ